MLPSPIKETPIGSPPSIDRASFFRVQGSKRHSKNGFWRPLGLHTQSSQRDQEEHEPQEEQAQAEQQEKSKSGQRKKSSKTASPDTRL